MLVQRDRGVLAQQPGDPVGLLVGQAEVVRGHPAELWGEVEHLEVDLRGQIVERPVSRIAGSTFLH
ncbi:hypothetical protein [Plantactinospora veratri]